MVKECTCSCEEKSLGPKEWKGMTMFKIVELDTLRGITGHTRIDSVIAKNKEDAIEKYYKIYPNASNRLIIYPEGCAEVRSTTRTKIP